MIQRVSYYNSANSNSDHYMRRRTARMVRMTLDCLLFFRQELKSKYVCAHALCIKCIRPDPIITTNIFTLTKIDPQSSPFDFEQTRLR